MNNPNDLVLREEDALALFSFLLAAARTQMDDPHYYASMRLLSGAEQLRDAMLDQCSDDVADMLRDTVAMSEAAQLAINDSTTHAASLDALNALVARFMVRHAGLDT